MKTLRKFILIVIFILIFLSLVKNILDYRSKMIFFQKFQSEEQKQEKENISLKTKILKSQDSFKIEQTIRDKLNLSKSNEVVVIIPSPTPAPVIVIPTQAPIWRQWVNVFFKD
jgi:cell division protein FtsB